MNRRILLTAALLTFHLSFYATHIVGGELYYDYLGNNKYRVTLKLYKDCRAVVTGTYDNPAYIGVYNGSKLVDSLKVPLPNPDTLKPATSPCYDTPKNVCVQEAIYSMTITLPPRPGGYTLVYQRCCRNSTIQNINSPGSVGASYFATIPDTNVVKTNNSPRYNNFPPVFVCVNAPLVFDHSASDSDGDSLYYYLCDTYEGGSLGNPIPIPPSAPPYSVVPWVSPYSGTNPMSASPALSIDPKTGLLTGTPNTIGQWVVGVCVNEYRGGKLIATHHRDFQFNVINCNKTPVVSVPAQNNFCQGRTVTFVNNSTGAATYHWDFGDNTTLADTSNLQSPSYTYPDTGTYKVTLTANPGLPCDTFGTATAAVYDPINAGFTITDYQCMHGNVFDFGANGKLSSKATFSWDFDTKATPSKSTLQNPTKIIYSDSGTFNVKLHITDHSCNYDTIAKITVVDCRITVPNVFSPNGDTKNETFIVKGLEHYPGSRIIIYNRWGRIIYENANYLNDWDANGISDGTYYFILYVSDGREGIPGFVSVVR